MQVGGTKVFWQLKRALDILLGLALLPLLLCVSVLALCFNPWLNPGPLVFSQPRIGRHGALFIMYKLRTMRCLTQAPSGQRFADTEIHRITPFGFFLRRYRLDELPQLLNVLRGDMSLIGPRPEQPGFVNEYTAAMPDYHRRHIVRPGLSGLSQVVQGYTSDTSGTRRKLALDLRYISQAGVRMEAYVFWRTLITVATGHGAI
ncbi:putative glycosyltransferase [Sulfitobacter noctilucae]|uniref:sugar transferase n=1 Tax=Sulfitobacter noctilucae TaxID=1342302 RepID=UPI0004696191|nr:sugar transferase [Sulfitobacter noctilucae]KIN61065.1 putative glycosyltransferase [Sulfitobacter noctilucae]